VVSLTTQRALHSGVVTLTWAVTETGSGIAGYDIDVSVGGSAFTRWRSTTETSAVYTGQRGVIYAFRVTAVDRANNTDSAEATALAETVRKYYALAVASGAAGRRVAMRENGVVYYLHADHLGSTSLDQLTTVSPASAAMLTLTCTRWATGGMMLILTGGSNLIPLYHNLATRKT
jgi:hypothetical protein